MGRRSALVRPPPLLRSSTLKRKSKCFREAQSRHRVYFFTFFMRTSLNNAVEGRMTKIAVMLVKEIMVATVQLVMKSIVIIPTNNNQPHHCNYKLPDTEVLMS